MFLLKKLLGPLLMPVPVVLFVLAAGVVVLWFTRRQRLGKILVTAGVVLFALASMPPLPGAALGALERTYPAFDPSGHAGEVAWVVVLSGGSAPDPALPALDRLSRPTLARLAEGVRILRAYPGARLLVTGGAAPGRVSEARLMRAAARTLGVDPARVTIEEASRDTRAQAAATRAIVGGDPFVLVTSASHLPRAAALFRAQGLVPIPAPADHLVKHGGENAAAVIDLYPSIDHLVAATTWTYETLGRIWNCGSRITECGS